MYLIQFLHSFIARLQFADTLLFDYFLHLYCSAGSEFSEDKFVSKVKMEIVVSKDQVYTYKIRRVISSKYELFGGTFVLISLSFLNAYPVKGGSRNR